MSKEDGGPAFPYSALSPEGVEVYKDSDGMTLRDYFAAKAMQGFMSRSLIPGFDEEMIALKAYEIADAMLAERAK